MIGFLAAVPVAASAQSDVRHVGSMNVRDSLFWDGPHVESSGAPAGWLASWYAGQGCTSGVFSCFDFTFDVAGRADRLRIAFDHPDLRDTFSFEVYDPNGRYESGHTSGSGAGSGLIGNYSREVFIKEPTPGTWRVHVIADHVTDSSFRMRAKLYDVVPPTGKGLLFPNLRVIPPFEMTFDQPVSIAGPGAPSPVREASCMADEVAEHQARVCLRFSIGPQNVGDGAFEVHYQPLESSPDSGVIMQRIYRADGTFVEREAGTYEYHKTHAHYHHAAFGDLKLFRVTNRRTGTMTLAGKGPKQGFCMGPYKIVEWTRFTQDPTGNVERDCSLANGPNGVAMGLERGWADVYTWELPGNYVEFGTNGDGYYVVQVKTDASGDIKEMREDDNVGYAYVRIEGATIEVLERGYGASPWDPHKMVETRDTLPPTAYHTMRRRLGTGVIEGPRWAYPGKR